MWLLWMRRVLRVLLSLTAADWSSVWVIFPYLSNSDRGILAKVKSSVRWTKLRSRGEVEWLTSLHPNLESYRRRGIPIFYSGRTSCIADN